jgi:ketosteroid isomerase-like protein
MPMANGKDMVRRLVDAANARDWGALLAVCAPDVSLIHPLAPVPYQGQDSVRAFFVNSVALFPDQYLHVDALLAEADVVALEGRITATEEGEPTVTPCAFFFTLRDGLVHQIRMYYDTATLEEEQ